MKLRKDQLDWLLQAIASPDRTTVIEGSETVDDWLDYFDADEGRQIGELLVGRAAAELNDLEVFESLTHSLQALSEYDILSDDIHRVAAQLPIPEGSPSVAEYLAYLRARAAGADVGGNFADAQGPADSCATPSDAIHDLLRRTGDTD